MTKRTTREKLLSYLSSEARRSGSSSFDIPFNRQQLADYLSVDRSAMSNELCHLRDEGLISFQKTTSRCNSLRLEEIHPDSVFRAVQMQIVKREIRS